MAQTEHLPIYKASYDLCLYLEQVVQGFSRYQKYSLGADLRDGARRVLKLVVRANSRRDKAPVLLEIREEAEELKVVLRLCQDVKAFPNFNSFEHAIRQMTEIAKPRARPARFFEDFPGPSIGDFTAIDYAVHLIVRVGETLIISCEKP